MDFRQGLELLQITGTTTLSMAVYSGYRQSLALDFLFLILPQYYAIVYPDRIWDLYLCLAMLVNVDGLKKGGMQGKRVHVVDHLRFTICVLVVTAIYAVDFSVFEKRLGKTEFYGISLMDVGVGSFIYNAGVVGHRGSTRRYLKSVPALIALGFVRYAAIRVFGISVNPREYGIHLNFYFLLAFVNLLYCAVRSRYNFVVGLLLTAFYEGALRFAGLEQLILSDSRNGLLEMNKEGLVAVAPYLSIFLISTEVGRICLSGDGPRRRALRLFVLTGLFGSLYMLFCLSSTPSRRLGNAPFVFWILMLHSLHLSVYMLFESMFAVHSMQTSRFCSANMMFVFLFSNLIVLLGNLLFNPRQFSVFGTHVHLLAYLAAVFTVPAFLSRRSGMH